MTNEEIRALYETVARQNEQLLANYRAQNERLEEIAERMAQSDKPAKKPRRKRAAKSKPVSSAVASAIDSLIIDSGMIPGGKQ